MDTPRADIPRADIHPTDIPPAEPATRRALVKAVAPMNRAIVLCHPLFACRANGAQTAPTEISAIRSSSSAFSAESTATAPMVRDAIPSLDAAGSCANGARTAEATASTCSALATSTCVSPATRRRIAPSTPTGGNASWTPVWSVSNIATVRTFRARPALPAAASNPEQRLRRFNATEREGQGCRGSESWPSYRRMHRRPRPRFHQTALLLVSLP